MKWKIKIILFNIIYFFIYLCCLLKFYKLIAFFIQISLRKIKPIKQKKKTERFISFYINLMEQKK